MKLPNLLVKYDGLHCASNHCWCEFLSTLVWWLVCWHGWQLSNCLCHTYLFLIDNWYREAQCTGDCSDLGRWVRTVLEQNPASDLIRRVLSSFDFKFLPCWSSCCDFPKPWTVSYKMKQILSSPSFFFCGGCHDVYYKNTEEFVLIVILKQSTIHLGRKSHKEFFRLDWPLDMSGSDFF